MKFPFLVCFDSVHQTLSITSILIKAKFFLTYRDAISRADFQKFVPSSPNKNRWGSMVMGRHVLLGGGSSWYEACV